MLGRRERRQMCGKDMMNLCRMHARRVRRHLCWEGYCQFTYVWKGYDEFVSYEYVHMLGINYAMRNILYKHDANLYIYI